MTLKEALEKGVRVKRVFWEPKRYLVKEPIGKQDLVICTPDKKRTVVVLRMDEILADDWEPITTPRCLACRTAETLDVVNSIMAHHLYAFHCKCI